MEAQKIGNHMAVAVSGLDIGRPTDPATQGALRQLLNDNLVLCIRGQTLAPVPFRDAMARFGTPMRRTFHRTKQIGIYAVMYNTGRNPVMHFLLVSGIATYCKPAINHLCKATIRKIKIGAASMK